MVRRDLWVQPLSLRKALRACCPEPHLDHFFSYLKGWRLHHLLGQPVAVPSQWKDVCCFQRTSCVSVCGHCLSVVEHHWEEPGPILFAPSLQVSVSSLLSLFLSGWAVSKAWLKSRQTISTVLPSSTKAPNFDFWKQRWDKGERTIKAEIA